LRIGLRVADAELCLVYWQVLCRSSVP
jgi:hypothetical protein